MADEWGGWPPGSMGGQWYQAGQALRAFGWQFIRAVGIERLTKWLADHLERSEP